MLTAGQSDRLERKSAGNDEHEQILMRIGLAFQQKKRSYGIDGEEGHNDFNRSNAL
jgi:hypothetical protein